MEAKLDGELEWDKSYVAHQGSNKQKLLNLAEKQRELMDRQYRQNQINKAKMAEKKRRQEKLEKLNKDAYKSSQIEMMEKNQIDPKVIEAAMIRAEDSSESESDDEIIIEKKRRKEEVVKKKLNLSDNFFHGRPLIRKPPINPFSFDYYFNQTEPQQEPEEDIVIKKKKKKKKKKAPAFPYPMMPFYNPDMFKNNKQPQIIQQPITAPTLDNSDAITELQKAMSLQNNLLGSMLDEFGKIKERQDMKKLRQDEEFAQMEMKFDEFDRHHNAVRGINALKNDLDKASNEAGLARIRAGFAQERMMDEFKRQIEEVKRTNFRDIGMRSLKNFNNEPNVIYQDVVSERRSRKKKKKKKKKITQINPQRRDFDQGPLYNEEEVKKLTDKLVKQKLKEALEKRKEPSNRIQDNILQNNQLTPQQQQSNDIIEGPNGITILRSKNPGEPPMVIMPDDKTSITSSKYSKSSKYSRRRYNPMDDFMNKMMMMNMMNIMNQKKEPKAERKKRDEEEEAIVIPLIDQEIKDPKNKKKKKKKKKKKDRAGMEIEPPRDNLREGFDAPMENTRSTFIGSEVQPIDYEDFPGFENEPKKLHKPEPKKETEPDPENQNEIQTSLDS